MEELAADIVREMEPSEGWWDSSAEDTLADVALTMLEHMDEDSVRECLHRTISVVRGEYGE